MQPSRPDRLSQARERALAALIVGRSLDESVCGFLRALADVIPFDRAALLGAGEGVLALESAPRTWKLEAGEIAPAGEWPGGSTLPIPAIEAGSGARLLSDPFVLAILKANGWTRPLVIPLMDAGEEPACLVLAQSAGSEDPAAFAPGPAGAASEPDAAAPLWTSLASSLRRERERRAVEQGSLRQSAELAALLDLVRTAARAVEFEDLFLGLASALQPLMDFDAFIALLDTSGHRELSLHLPRPLAPGQEDLLAERAREAWRALSGQTGEALQARVMHMHGFDSEEPPAAAPPLVETLPILRRGEAIGLLAVAATQGRLTDSLARVLASASSQVSLTVDRLLADAESRSELMNAVIDSISDGIVLTDPGGRVRMRNAAAAAHLQALTGHALPSTIRDFGGVGLALLAEPVLSGREPVATAEIALSSPRRLFSVTVTPLAGPRGRPAGLVLVTSDISRARAMQEQMHQTEKLSALGEMISGIAHELNNPLASVMGYAQLLESARVRPEVRVRLGTIVSEAQRCQRIVNNLLSFARKHTPEQRPLSLNEVVQSVLALTSYQMRADGVEITVDLSNDLPTLRGDFHQLQQAVLNILTNAHHALLDHPAEKFVRVLTRRVEGGAVLEVSDTGPGIEKEDLTRIFDPFFTTKEVGKGTGLGLSIATGIVASHAGRLSADSDPGRGATFTMFLPVGGRAADGAAPDTGEPGLARSRLPGRRILVVEDEAPLSRLLAETLTADGHRVETAADGLDALVRLEKGLFDVIITDMKMPRLGGRQLYESVTASRPELARLFIFATGDMISEDSRTFLDRTGRPVLAKPFSVLDLRRLVDRVLDSH